MQHWWQLATRHWRTRPARSALAILAVTLGVGVVVWVTCCYESVRCGVTEVVLEWIGRSHVVVEHTQGVWDTFDQQVEDLVRQTPGVVRTTSHTREYVWAAPPTADGQPPLEGVYVDVEIMGVVPQQEHAFRTHKLAAGRFLQPGDEHAVVIEKLLADEFKLGLKDSIYLRDNHPSALPQAFTIVGIEDRRRASVNQAMMAWTRLEDVQSLCNLPGQVKSVDVILADASVENIRRVAADLQERLDKYQKRIRQDEKDSRLVVKTTEAQLQKLGAAQGLLQFIMMLLSCVVLLTAFFIILATMSMGVTERITELGLLRCVGVTRWQLGSLVLLQTLPLGVLGTLLGLPLGLALQWITIQAVPDYLGVIAYSTWGISLAAFGGIGTALCGAALPAIRAVEVTPAEAARAGSDEKLSRWVWICAGLGVAMLIGHELLNRWLQRDASTFFDQKAITGLILLYLGGALIVPAIVVALGRVVVFVAARLLGLRPQLLGDEIGKAPFRAAAISSGLMVGLSLIVGLVVWGESVKAGWQFPKEFPDALFYIYEYRTLDKVRALREVPGVKQFTVCDDFQFWLKDPRAKSLLERLNVNLQMKEQFQRFMATDPDQGLELVKLTFLEGNERDAVARFKAGGHILVTREFAKAEGKGLNDKVEIWAQTAPDDYASATFTIAGVVASPGLDIAISFFNAESHFQSYAVGAVIGTLDDAQRLFDRDSGKLVLFNFDFAEDDATRVYSDSGETITAERQLSKTGRPTYALISRGPIPGEGREIQVINEMLKRLDYPIRAFVTARELKQQIDRNISRVTMLLSAIPVVGLLIAALGLGNLMAANVASRSREIAVLRAIGVTKSQVSRIVIGEALVLGLLGSGLGLVLGLGLARTSNLTTELLSGFRPEFSIPWRLVAPGALLATLLCILAALIPARHAARSNIVAALSDL